MTSPLESVFVNLVPRPRASSWLRWGVVVFLVIEAFHLLGGLLINEWEGWDVFVENLVAVVVAGLVITGLTFGLLVRWGLKPSKSGRNRPAAASLALGVLSVLSFGLFFLWAPMLLSPGAILLGREGLEQSNEKGRGRGIAIGGTLLGLASFLFGIFLILYALTHDGDFPFGLF